MYIHPTSITALFAGLLLICAGGEPAADHGVHSKPFAGVKVNGGTVGYTEKDRTLTLSDDFMVPDSPAPHWQLVDSLGNRYLLQRLAIKGDKVNKAIAVPAHVADVAVVQIWCSWAEVLLGEAKFDKPVAASVHPEHQTAPFMGVKANKGFAKHVRHGAKSLLVLSDDFVVPEAPAPHWQVVDSQGRVFLLQRLTIKGDKLNKTIEVPAYVKDVAKVQIWCAWAETLLGEAGFAEPVM